MNNSENFGSLLSAASIAALVMEVITQSSIAIVVEIRTGWPFRHPSPKNCPGSNT
jgi:hypothetical protein